MCGCEDFPCCGCGDMEMNREDFNSGFSEGYGYGY